MERSDVIVTGFRLNAPAAPAKVLQTTLGLGEAEAKAMSKRFPCVVLADVAWAEAERIALLLRDAGAYAKVSPAVATKGQLAALTTDAKPAFSHEPASAITGAERPSAETTQLEVAPASVPPPTGVAPPRPAHATQLEVVPPTAPVSASPSVAPRPTDDTQLEVRSASPPAPAAAADGSAFDIGHAPTLYSPGKPQAEPRASLPYALGELVIPKTESSPAPVALELEEVAPARAALAPAQQAVAALQIKSQPAPALKSQPAPAPRSQPAPAPKSQPARAPGSPQIEATGLRMLDEGFGEERSEGPPLELDYGPAKPAAPKATKRSQRHAAGGPQHDVEERRGFWATLLLPVFLLQAAVPHALALTGVAAASGAAVYIARRATNERATNAAESNSFGAERKHPKRAKRSGLLGLLDEITGDAEDKIGGGNQGELDAEGKTGPSADKSVDTLAATEATHPLVKLAPKPMEPAIASILRQRFRGVHKVSVVWPEDQAPEGKVECMLVEQAHAGNLKQLISTGRPVAAPPQVRSQLLDHIGVLRAADNDATGSYIPICLAN